ncbi:MAG: RagB/SusD family nutrient uptake outer membrane protein [Citrobacter freundii]|nr:MAG: RagB/SusD family nutrient uptake outer membrane protein [Citrobacter freundii]
MKRLSYLILIAGVVGSLTSCKKYLEKPDTTGTTTAETVFSNRAGAEAAMANAYRQILAHGLWPDGGINNGTLPGLSGESSFAESWMTLSKFITAGFSAQAYDSRPAQSPDNLFNNYRDIRRCYVVLENADKPTDMTDAEKNAMKAEMKALIAYRYMGMMIRYGGVPLVTKSLASTDDLNIPRATLQETVDFIKKLCDEAITGLPDTWDPKYTGRLTKGAVMAIKARTLLYAARPLFNSAAPYLPLSGSNNLICFGNASNDRWNDVITANEAVITWANANGYELINSSGIVNAPNTNAFDDYATATSTPNNKEVLLAYKYDIQNDKFFRFYNAAFTGERYLIDNYGLLTNFLENYYKADGTNQVWPGVGQANAQPFSVFQSKMNEMEPRFWADNMPHTFNARNNPGDITWNYNARNTGDLFGKGGNRGPSGRGKGAAITVKFYYKAGTRNWFEFPIFRMADFYLSLAEAYNETGNTTKALENLNKVHNRAGLPSITETNQALLRKAIQREWAIEFYYENRRFFDVRHWKLDNIGNGIIGGPMRELQFTITGDALLPSGYVNFYDNVVYSTYWDPKMFLFPIPQEEVDKGVVLQNPGY